MLTIPLVGFLPGSDARVSGTIDAITRGLGRDGFVSRYSTAQTDDGLAGDEGQFLACSFWLVSALALNGRTEHARALFERLIALCNDLGLLAEEYDVRRRRQVGNFPQRSAISRSSARRMPLPVPKAAHKCRFRSTRCFDAQDDTGMIVNVTHEEGGPAASRWRSATHPFLYEINTWPWLNRLSTDTGRRIDLGSVPDEHWDASRTSVSTRCG